jgi:hypothetical protein
MHTDITFTVEKVAPKCWQLLLLKKHGPKENNWSSRKKSPNSCQNLRAGNCLEIIKSILFTVILETGQITTQYFVNKLWIFSGKISPNLVTLAVGVRPPPKKNRFPGFCFSPEKNASFC